MKATAGRPKGHSGARDALIEAARSCFTVKGYERVSTRELARKAGVDAAMIRYYFGSKAGLFEAMVRDTIAPVLEAFKHYNAAQSHQSTCEGSANSLEPSNSRLELGNNSLEPSKMSLDSSKKRPEPGFGGPFELMQVYYRAMAANPALPGLIIQVLNHREGSEAFDALASVFSDMLSRSRLWIRQLGQHQGLNPNLDPTLARLSFVSLMVFPLIAPAHLMRDFGVELNETWLKQLAEHNAKVLHQGLLRQDIAANPGSEEPQ
ncbi:TetR/AcrR family transcriptional regulator [Shewanella algae]|uniref:TetR/AcrR family transcriptional regulator n=1 Tax=Shewanella algae TaxID=38313 RepID=UPI001AACF22B|nr:TetR family transcriptional regulator [Shewanella algae]MBO2700261.1 helix-turn-helix transcriptional regulator [Shewanella algae]HDS1202353.1 helix-turn-helix transcriptional regulator [Shewanella algae]